MIPIITGVVASSIIKAGVFSWVGALDQCGAVTGYTAYTTSPTLSIGVKIYYNESLTSTWFDFLGSLFFYNNVAYILDEDSAIVTNYQKINNVAVIYGGCGDGGVVGNIYHQDANFSIGSKVFSTCYADSTYYLAGGLYYLGEGMGQNILEIGTVGDVVSYNSCGT